MTEPSEVIRKIQQRLGQLRSDRQTYHTTWTDLRDHLLPKHGRGLSGGTDLSERHDGSRGDFAIYDGTPLRAVKIAAAGLQSGLTSPSRAWFTLGAADVALSERRDVRVWLWDVEERMRAVFNRSNLYNTLHHLYLELLTFATGSMGIFESLRSLLWCRPYTIGEYWIGSDAEGHVDTFCSSYVMTAEQMVATFGDEACSEAVRQAAKDVPDKGFTVYQIIESNDSRFDVGLKFPIRSIHFEDGTVDKLLGVRGFNEFPVLAVRWDVIGQDTWGVGPGHDILGDCKQLQKLSKGTAIAVDKVLEPPMVAPGTMKRTAINTVPGGITYTDDPDNVLRPLYQVEFRQQEALMRLNDLRTSIAKGLFNDLFLMLLQIDVGKMTATEVAERKQEKLLMLGPVCERMHYELLDPLIDRTFAMMARAGLIPPAPPELQGAALRVEYISPLAIAQRQLGLNGLNQLLVSVASLSQVSPESLDKIDFDEAVDLLAEGVGAPPRVLRDETAITATREQRAKAQQAQQMAQSLQTGAAVAKDASGATLGNDSVLSRALGSMPQ